MQKKKKGIQKTWSRRRLTESDGEELQSVEGEGRHLWPSEGLFLCWYEAILYNDKLNCCG